VYNLVVIGAGSGGLVSAAGAAGVYAKVSVQCTQSMIFILHIVHMFLVDTYYASANKVVTT
jgi:hypothetical protein